MTESQEEIQNEEPQPSQEPQDVLETLRAENEGLKAQLLEAQSATEGRQDSDAQLQEAQTENQRLRRRLTASAADTAVLRAAEQLGIPTALAKMHSHKFTCELDSDAQVTITPDPVEFFESELKRDPTLRAAVDSLSVNRRSIAAAAGAVDIEKADPVELLSSLDRNPARKTRFIARHGVKAYLELCDRARRC
jgi:hypothetical protein